MKNSRNLTIGVITATLGLIFGVTVGSRLSPSQPTVSAQSPLTSATITPAAHQPVVQKTPSSPATPMEESPRLAQAPGGPRVIHVPQEAEPITPSQNTKTQTPFKTTRAAPTAKMPQNAPVVCVDPGHPSETSDGANAHGLSENRLNWQVALRLRDILEHWGIRCVLTKQSENQYVTNRQRAEIANRARALVFVRLHCDVGSGRGFTWYYPDRTGKKYGISGPPKDIQLASRDAAFIINEAMKPVLKGYLQSNAIKTDASTFVGSKQGGVLTGSIFARVPTALIEMCYINQKRDAEFIASAQGRDKMAEALARGIYTYVHR
jgi:N-acetylmuramoyl-L-alanine amidase